MKLLYLPLAFAALLLTLSGCTKLNRGVVGMFDLDTDLKLVFEVGDNINPDEKHSPSPLYIRLYELGNDKTFSKLDFLELYEKDSAQLGNDLLAKQELEAVLPGASRQERFVLNPETRYVALFAEFYQYRDAKFKAIFPVTPSNVVENTAVVEIVDNKLILRQTR